MPSTLTPSPWFFFPPFRADTAAGKETGAAKVSKNLTSPV